jgi:hemolysin-activating ACP:hemolysin acyltransferase
MHDDIKIIISLFKRFDRYKRFSDMNLLYHILPSYHLKQYKLHKQGDEVIAYTNWAFLSDEAEKRFLSTTFLKPEDWNSGDKIWHMDTVCIKNVKKIMFDTREYFRKIMKVGDSFNWVRISDDGKIYRRSAKFRREWHKK